MRGWQLLGAVAEGGARGARSGGEAVVPVVQAADLWQTDHTMEHGLIWVILVATSCLLIVAVVRGVRRHNSAIEILDGTFLGVVGLFTCVTLLCSATKSSCGSRDKPFVSAISLGYLPETPRRVVDVAPAVQPRAVAKYHAKRIAARALVEVVARLARLS